MKKLIFGALALMAATAPAQATVSLDSSVLGSTTSFNDSAAVPGAYTFSSTPAGLTGGNIVAASLVNQYATPYGSTEGNPFLAVLGGTAATLYGEIPSGLAGFLSVSLYWGSIDQFNTLEFLDGSGNVIGSFGGLDITVPADGDQTEPATNRFVTFSSDSPIAGLRFLSNGNSFEVDNVAFSNAVPEPATWAMMLVGFGAIGSAMRRRRVMKPSFI